MLDSHPEEHREEIDPTLAHNRHLLQLERKTPNPLPKECPDLEPTLDPTLAYDRHFLQLVCVLLNPSLGQFTCSCLTSVLGRLQPSLSYPRTQT